MSKDPTTNPACGECCWFIRESIDGSGLCIRHYCENGCERMCDEFACGEFTDRKKMRHHLATLIQHNRWRRDDNVPNNRRMCNPTEIGQAIDFAIEYIKQFSKI